MLNNSLNLLVYFAFACCVSVACYVRPVPDDFDRYIYEALVRGRSQPVETIYRIVKHENPRAEASSVLDSAQHLGQLEPLYAIRPLYIESVSLLSLALGPQKSITAVSAISFFLIGYLLFVWTRNPVLSSLILISPAVLSLGRLGTPDALSTLVVISGLYLLFKNRTLPAISLLLVSIWIRTDNVLVALTALAWMAFTKRMSVLYASLLASLGLASVAFINHYAGNYGYLVLFRYSFIAGKYPAEIAGGVTVRQYLRALFSGMETALPQSAPWVLLGVLGWRWLPSARSLLWIAAAAAAVHFALFPSPEIRYVTWAYLLCAIVFVLAVAGRPESWQSDAEPDFEPSLAA